MENNSNYLLITYANRSDWGLENLKKTLKKFKYNYSIIGKGDVWNGWKTIMNAMFKKLSKLPENQLVCKMDAFDVLVTAPPNEFLEKWSKFKTPIVVGAESCKAVFPVAGDYYEYHALDCSKMDYPYFNAGCIIGYAGPLAAFYKWALDNDYSDDQVALINYANKFPEKVGLDHQQEIIANVTIFDNLDLENERVYNSKTDTWPIFIHIPGYTWDFFRRMDKYGKQILGDDYKPVSWWNRIKMFLIKLKDGVCLCFKQYFWICISVLIFLAFLIYWFCIRG